MGDNRENLTWEEVSTEHIIRDEWIDFRRSAYRLPDGNVFEPFYSYSRRDYVIIVASDCDGNYLCVRQFRQGVREVTTEFPAGGLERSDGREYGAGGLERSDGREYGAGGLERPDRRECNTGAGGIFREAAISGTVTSENGTYEDAFAAAKRELLEETGYLSSEWTHLLTIPSDATISDNFAHVYMAKNCRMAARQHLDETEFLNVELHTPQEIEEMIRTGRFQQAVHVMAWLLARQ
ncbi:MAG: NUDIX hydrolase [Lachnospiraceae bacterium]|jgi:8-oxo-dGTP pyrophosphatase MutT (NUDIX family)|nr:NUDIX hydrolase [Lachnospiraceae bacterium]